MQTHLKTMLVVICEAPLEKLLTADALRLGASGYTITDVRGSGRGGAREGAWDADRSIEMKVICNDDVARRLAAHVLETYGENYALTIYLKDVRVLRPEKF
ncbi:MAG: P-II family nitrogen regulator [Burkholderiales bacterium]